MYHLTDEEVIDLLTQQLPQLLERHPDIERLIYLSFLKAFVRKEEMAKLTQEMRDFREETHELFEQVDQRFEQVDQRFDRLEGRMEEGFHHLQSAIDRLGSRWGIRNESLFRQAMVALLEESFGAKVGQRTIQGEQFDVVIVDGGHILVEITASAGPSIQQRLERKRALYRDEEGIEPTRFILATASIHSMRANELRQAGFEVVEPEEEAL